MDLLRTNHELMSPAVEEFLRYDAPVDTTLPRFAKEDVQIGGTLIHTGEAVLCALSSANRDLPVIGDADTLGISRPDIRHISFGHGIHFCVGAALARLEASVAIAALLDRCDGITLAVPGRAGPPAGAAHPAAGQPPGYLQARGLSQRIVGVCGQPAGESSHSSWRP
jgi:cytochrome P450